jgi:hypothetical protein
MPSFAEPVELSFIFINIAIIIAISILGVLIVKKLK